MQVDWDVLIVVGTAFGISKAFTSTGAAQLVTDGLPKDINPIAALLLIYIITNIMTELITNVAAAAIMFPIAVNCAVSTLHVSPTPFIVAVAFAASSSFSTPIGYQTNMMVYGPGGYKFTDYLKIGIPLNLIYATTTIILAPLIWPF